MHVVAVSRWGSPLQQELPALASLAGVAPYDLRLRVAGVLPAVMCSVQDAARAQVLVAQVRGRGHGAVTLDAVAVPCSIAPARSFEVTEEALRCALHGGAAVAVAFADVVALVRVASVSTDDVAVVTQQKKLALGRALLSGGLMMRKKVETVSRARSEQREQVLYVFGAADQPPLVLREQSLHYDGLGADLKPTTLHCFTTLVGLLRGRAPTALFDDRFVTHKRRTGITQVTGKPDQRSVRSDNDAENELAAQLLVKAHRERQL